MLLYGHDYCSQIVGDGLPVPKLRVVKRDVEDVVPYGHRDRLCKSIDPDKTEYAY